MLLTVSKITGSSALLKGGYSVEFLPLKCGLKYLKPPPIYDDIDIPENPKLKMAPKVPVLPKEQPNIKMRRLYRLIRYPELVHNKLIHKQYGVKAINGGWLHHKHFELIRNTIHRNLDFKRIFAIWRVDAPWQSRTKRAIGFTLGGGKGSIHHYVTPVGPDRIIFELAGKCEYEEVKSMLELLAKKMPFEAKAVSQELLLKDEQKQKEVKEQNMNPYTWEYMIKNNMAGCRKYVRKIDYMYFGKYI